MSEASASVRRGESVREGPEFRETPARVAIVGLGLMGGSLARALKRLPEPPVVRASTADAKVVQRALADAVADDVTLDPAAVLDGAELVVYATPVGVTIDLLAAHRDLVPADAAIIDVGSVKAPVVEAARAARLTDRFVGCHPMCGSERSGYAAADAAMFEGATTWIVPGAESAPVDRVAALWRSVGAVPSRIDAQAHDRLVAWISHMPQIVASALGGVLAGASFRPDVLGPGGRDMTRLARSPSALWTDILLRNRVMLDEPIAALRARLEAFAEAIASGNAAEVGSLLAEANAWADPTPRERSRAGAPDPTPRDGSRAGTSDREVGR